MENKNTTYSFFPDSRWSWLGIRQTYQSFFRQGLKFWGEHSYDIPLGLTFRVLLGIMIVQSVLQGVVSKRHDFISCFFSQIGFWALVAGFFGFILLMKEWLEAKGSFREYLAFGTYAHFIFLPLVVISALSAQLGGLFKLGLFIWILYAFYKTFRLVLSRFLVLAGIVWGIAFLAFVGAFIAGLKMLD